MYRRKWVKFSECLLVLHCNETVSSLEHKYRPFHVVQVWTFALQGRMCYNLESLHSNGRKTFTYMEPYSTDRYLHTSQEVVVFWFLFLRISRRLSLYLLPFLKRTSVHVFLGFPLSERNRIYRFICILHNNSFHLRMHN